MLSRGNAGLRIVFCLLPLSLTAIVALHPLVAVGQERPDELLPALRAAFRAVDYATVDSLAGAALSSPGAYAPDQLVEIHTLLGLSQYYRGMEPEAASQFEAALSLDPDLEMDPLLVPPQAREFFARVRADFDRDRPPADEQTALRYVIVHDNRPAAAVRSFVLPGWGQWYKRERAKGIAIGVLWAGTTVGALTTHLAHDRARERYEAAGPDEVSARYDEMNRLHKVRKYLAFGALGVWVYSTVDAVVLGGPAQTASAESGSGLHLSLGPDLLPTLFLRARL